MKVPSYAHPGDAGLDIYSAVDEIIKPGEIKLIPTGIMIAVPRGYEAQIRPKSGLALKGLSIVNTPGTIDSGYRGEVKIIMINFGKDSYVIGKDSKIAQMVINKVEEAQIKIVSNLEDTPRGEGGFGSTGLK